MGRHRCQGLALARPTEFLPRAVAPLDLNRWTDTTAFLCSLCFQYPISPALSSHTTTTTTTTTTAAAAPAVTAVTTPKDKVWQSPFAMEAEAFAGTLLWRAAAAHGEALSDGSFKARELAFGKDGGLSVDALPLPIDYQPSGERAKIKQCIDDAFRKTA